MERVIVVVVLAAVAAVVAYVVSRRTRDESVPVPTGFHVPAQLHRSDFERADAEWLVAVFTSATCNSCATMIDKARALESDAVAVVEVEVTAQAELHERYGIDGVPTTVIADADGAVRSHFLGPATATDLWAAVAEVREPGSVPSSCDAHSEGHLHEH